MNELSRPGESGGHGEPASLIDWSIAASTGALLVGGGPSVPKAEADRAVAQLTGFARDAELHVRELTGLGTGLAIPEAEVVDRPGWVRAAAAGLDTLTSRASASAQNDRRSPVGQLFAGSAGVQTGLALAFLGSKVLGQYEPFGENGEGRLLLVAPNIVQAERALDVSPDDFRLWVCVHECTHRIQFTAVDWLADYFVDEVGRFVSSVDESAADALSRLPSALRKARDGSGTLGVVEAMQSPRQRAAFDRIIALTTVLEGHADYVMDAVGEDVLPSVATLRRKLTERRRGGGLLDRLLRSLLGLDAKIKQYEQGSAFTRQVVAQAGMDGFNAVWRSPNTLPSRAELADPQAWLRRIQP